MFYSLASGLVIYALVEATIGFRLSRELELAGCDVAIHGVTATSDKDHFYDDVADHEGASRPVHA
jgi:ammonia channel protein AmtB